MSAPATVQHAPRDHLLYRHEDIDGLDGVTILLSSHNSEDIQLLCDHVWRMSNDSLLASE